MTIVRYMNKLLNLLSLNRVVPAVTEMPYKVEDVQCSLVFDSVQLSISGDECTNPAHTGTAMDHHWTMFLAIMKFINPLLEGKHVVPYLGTS